MTFASPFKSFLLVIIIFQLFFMPFICNAAVGMSDVFGSEYGHVDFIDDPIGMDYAGGLGLSSFDEGRIFDLHNTLVNIIRYFLTFGGIVAVSMIIAGGFKYMLSGGNSDAISSARSHLSNGIVGLIIIITSYTLVGTVLRTVEALLLS